MYAPLRAWQMNVAIFPLHYLDNVPMRDEGR
jgi:hypothetical protein